MPPILLLALLNPVADITVSRTVNSISAGTGKLTLAGGSCKSSDAYGSNDCVLDWGKSYTAAANGTLTKAIESGDTRLIKGSYIAGACHRFPRCQKLPPKTFTIHCIM